MVYASTGSYACLAIMSLMLHLSIGDVWNTVNNVERRYGASVIGVVLVWLSKAHASYQYFQVDPMAGKILALTLIWLTIASVLITRTWQLNPDPATGKPEPLYPVKGGKAKTRYIWFHKYCNRYFYRMYNSHSYALGILVVTMMKISKHAISYCIFSC